MFLCSMDKIKIIFKQVRFNVHLEDIYGNGIDFKICKINMLNKWLLGIVICVIKQLIKKSKHIKSKYHEHNEKISVLLKNTIFLDQTLII